MAFAPAQNHEVKLSISLIHQVPSVPAEHHKSLVHTEKTKEMCHFTDVEMFQGLKGERVQLPLEQNRKQKVCVELN